jgi:ferredoxin/methylmalonyl-CoA mutase cobalamin-binding subunit
MLYSIQRAKGEYKMSTYEITFSPTGGTKKVTEIITSQFDTKTEEISLLPSNADYSKYTFTQNDVCVIAVPSFGGRVPETAVGRIKLLNGNGAKAVLVCVYGNRAYEDTLMELKDAASAAGFIPVMAVAAVAEHSIMRQFAAGRPDDNDKETLESYGKKIWEKIQSKEELSEVHVPGNKDYREYGGVPFKPSADKKCNSCGVCAKECPTGAIPIKEPKKIDKEKCISCMRCIIVCPQKARGLNQIVLKGAAVKMAKVFKERKENEFFE